MDASFFDISPVQWVMVFVIALVIGMAKAGIAGLGITVVPLIAYVFPAGRSVGILLPMLIAGDAMAVLWYRRHAVWKDILRALPIAVVGIVGGYLFMKNISFDGREQDFKRLIGGIVLFMLAFSTWQSWRTKHKSQDEEDKESSAIGWPMVLFLGLLGGFSTMAANAAGPVFVMYLLYLGLEKNAFVGTMAWLFIIINLVKVPFHWDLGNISPESLVFNLQTVPFIAVGFCMGIWLVKKLSQDKFVLVVRLLTAAAAVKMLV